jgi:hypothetical protein
LHLLVQAIITGSKKIRVDPVKRKLPLRPCHLQTFLKVANCTNDFDDFLFATILSCSFYACHQTGEQVQKNDMSLQEWRKIIKRASLQLLPGHAGHHLPYHKSDCFYHNLDMYGDLNTEK